jgi:hypothetical protein
VYVVGVRSISLSAGMTTGNMVLTPVGSLITSVPQRKPTAGTLVLDSKNAWFMDGGKHRYFTR